MIFLSRVFVIIFFFSSLGNERGENVLKRFSSTERREWAKGSSREGEKGEMKEKEARAQTRAKKRKKRVAELLTEKGFSSGKNGRRAKEKIKGKRFV